MAMRPPNMRRKSYFRHMVDVVDTRTRSRMMSGIRGKNTRPEQMIRKSLYEHGLRYRLHSAHLPGKPDIVFPSRKAVILVHGCFWHGHDCHLFKWPSSRVEFWNTKINRNKEKDEETHLALTEQGWRSLVIWECALKGKTRQPYQDVVEKTVSWIRNGTGDIEIKGTVYGTG